MSGQFAPFHELTPGNQGGYVVVISISLTVLTLCVSAIRFGIAYRSRLKFELDDVSFVLSTASLPWT
jgi:hypothetical protein